MTTMDRDARDEHATATKARDARTGEQWQTVRRVDDGAGTAGMVEGAVMDQAQAQSVVEALGAPVPIDAAPLSKTIMFFVPQAPQGKQSPRAVQIGGFARVVKDPKTRKYEGMVSMFASQAMGGRPPLAEPVSIHLAVWLQVPESWSQKKRRAALDGSLWPMVKPDCSNILKAIEDGCNGIVFVDDKQITSVRISKKYGEKPGVAVMVRPI